MIEIVRTPAFATVQDLGRDGHRRSGVPPGGAMDRLSLQVGNALLGNAVDCAAIEWALTGGTLRFTERTEFVITGADAEVQLGGADVRRGVVTVAESGELLDVARITAGRFLYVCVGGGIDVPPVLGGRGTYLPAAFGGLHGRRLAAGDGLPAGKRHTAPVPRAVEVPDELDTLRGRTAIRVSRGPQGEFLSSEEWEELPDQELTIAAESDRAGYRLVRPSERSYRADARSEPTCVGAVQLTPDGNLIVLMPDGPTVGGYPKVAVVATCDLPRLAQRSPGEKVSLQLESRARISRANREQARALSDTARSVAGSLR